MSWQSSAVYHEARANALQVELDDAKARIAQLEDELTVSKDETIAAYQFTKPPVTIDTSTEEITTVTNSGPGEVTLPDNPGANDSTGLALLAVVVAFVALIWFLKRK